MNIIDLNADLGEGGAEDELLLGLVSSCNIACGGHAGNEAIMRRTVALAKTAGVAIGAHPGYEDRADFGRLEMHLPPDQVTDLVERQVRRLLEIAGDPLHHVKPHGALYNQANRDGALAAAVVAGVVRVSEDLQLFALPTGALAAAGRAAGLIVRAEGFADRRYGDDGSLLPRSETGAVITDIDAAVRQALRLTANGGIDTLCVHGDGIHAVAMLRAIRAAFKAVGLSVGHQLRDRS